MFGMKTRVFHALRGKDVEDFRGETFEKRKNAAGWPNIGTITMTIRWSL